MTSYALSDVEKHVVSNIRCVRIASNTQNISLRIGPKNIVHYNVTKFPCLLSDQTSLSTNWLGC